MTTKKIAAFTIMELTIAMLLSALIIGITYTAYQLLNKSYLSFNNKNEDMAAILRVDELLQKDFSRAESITYAAKQLVFKDSLQLIKYQFTPDYIIRYSTITDTFKIKGNEITPMFEKNILSNEITDDESQHVVDALRINLLFKQDTVTYNYIKSYGSQNLIKATTNAIN